MSDFLRGQMDYLTFVCSLGFALLSVASLALRRADDDRLPWFWVGLFALLSCLAEWQSLVADSTDYGDQFAALGACILLCSVVCLVEFCRRAHAGVTDKGPGWWIHVPFCSLALLGGLAGWDGLYVASRYALGLVGVLWIPAVLYQVSKKANAELRRPLIAAIWICVTHALLATAIVPKAGFFPASVVNRETVLGSTGLLVPVARALLSLAAAAAAWHYYRYVRYVHTGHDSLRRLGRLMAIGVPAILLVGWVLTLGIGSASDSWMRADLLSKAETAAASIDLELTDRLAGPPSDAATPEYKRLRRCLQQARRRAGVRSRG